MAFWHRSARVTLQIVCDVTTALQYGKYIEKLKLAVQAALALEHYVLGYRVDFGLAWRTAGVRQEQDAFLREIDISLRVSARLDRSANVVSSLSHMAFE